jgi:NAD(P)-dependent dehydrogenase (short-subunit alcohol dehydrogenase family)
MTGRMDGRKTIITGGANGLGAATARLFAAEGSQVVLADLARAEASAAEVIADIEGKGGNAKFVTVDVTDPDGTIEAVDRAAELMGGLDTVIASAGVGSPPLPDGKSVRNLVDLDIAGFDLVMDINLRGVFVTCQRAAQIMIENGTPGAMITLASMASKRPTAGVYSISKAAVWMMTRCMAHELGKYGIRLNALGPGYIDTELFRSMMVSGAGDDPAAQEAWLAGRTSQISLGELGLPDDVAKAALFLCSDEGRYFTGSILHPDGGFTSTFGGG